MFYIFRHNYKKLYIRSETLYRAVFRELIILCLDTSKDKREISELKQKLATLCDQKIKDSV